MSTLFSFFLFSPCHSSSSFSLSLPSLVVTQISINSRCPRPHFFFFLGCQPCFFNNPSIYPCYLVCIYLMQSWSFCPARRVLPATCCMVPGNTYMYKHAGVLQPNGADGSVRSLRRPAGCRYSACCCLSQTGTTL